MEDTSKQVIAEGRAFLGIELGSTRIKAVVIDGAGKPLASGDHGWENRLENGLWTYTLEDIWTGLQDAYANMAKDVKDKYGVEVTGFKAMGFSAMMHGYMAFDEAGELLVPFRTWRNTNTQQAAEELTELLQFNIPQRWSVSHLYQAILNGEGHVSRVSFLTTLAGYVHWKLTGKKVLGIGDAAGMFPIDSTANTYDKAMLAAFDQRTAEKGFTKKMETLLPQVLLAGEDAGTLTAEGAKILDPTGRPGLPAGRRRRHRHGRHQLCGGAYQQRVRRYLCVCHVRSGEGPQPLLHGDRHGHYPHRQACGHGPLQQLHQRDQRLGVCVPGLPGGSGAEARYERHLYRHVPLCPGRGEGRRRPGAL